MRNGESPSRWSRRAFLSLGSALTIAGLDRTRRGEAHNLPSGQVTSAVYEKALRADGEHKAVFQSPFIEAVLPLSNRLDHLLLLQAKNWLNSLQFSYGVNPGDLHMVVATYASANLLTYGDAVWGKYRFGEKYNVIDPSTTAPAARNLFWPRRFPADATTDPDDPQSVYQDAGMEALQKRGVLFLT